MIFVCQITLQDHVIRTLYDFMVRGYPAKFGGHSLSDSSYKDFSLSSDLARL